MPFDYTLDFQTVDFRQQPELYRVGKGEQGVLLVQPYKARNTAPLALSNAGGGHRSRRSTFTGCLRLI